MSSEVHKYIETALDKKQSLFHAEVIDFPNDNYIANPTINTLDLKASNDTAWKLYDKSNINEDGDQLKAVTGICFMLGALIIMGLYSNLV